MWGGDVSFSNLDLRLDVLERELRLPFTFVSGHIHELQIHVPWTRLNAEPIVITINTIGIFRFAVCHIRKNLKKKCRKFRSTIIF